MKLIGIMPVRNEDWVLGLSLRAMLMWVDEVIVLNHASTDKTEQILAEVSAETDRVYVVEEREPVWREMEHRQKLLTAARQRGATHISILDADEVLIGERLPQIRTWIEGIGPGKLVKGPMRHCHRGIEKYRADDSVWCMGGYIVSIAFADSPGLCWQTMDGYDHHHREPFGARLGGTINVPAVMHLQFANWRRLTAKHALYKVTERIRWPQKPVSEIDRMYSMALDERNIGTQRIPPSWWKPYRPLMKHLKISEKRVPWQEAECRRLVKEHGATTFKGLNLFGVVR